MSISRFIIAISPDPVDPALVPIIMLEGTFEDGQVGCIPFAPATGASAERCTMHGVNEILYLAMPYQSSKGSVDANGLIRIVRNGDIVRQEPGVKSESFVENGSYD